MKKSTLSFVIATAIASFATNVIASPKSAPAFVTEAQQSAHIAAENYNKALDTFNRAPASERAYAAEKLDAATNSYQTAVLKEKVAIKQWLTPSQAAPSPVAAQATPTRAPVAVPPAAHIAPVAKPEVVAPVTYAPHAIPQAVPTAGAYKVEVAAPTLIAPPIAPIAKPVSTGYREPQNVATPEAPKAYAVPAAPVTAKAPITAPTLIAPHIAPEAKPVSTGYREPQNVATPATPAPYAVPAPQDDSWKYKGETAAKYQNEVAAKYQNEKRAAQPTSRIANLSGRALTVNGTTVTGDLSGTTGMNQDIAQAIYKKLDQSQYVTDHAQDRLDINANKQKADDNAQQISTLGGGVAQLAKDVTNKVDKTDFDADQKLQDDAIKQANTDIRNNTTAIKSKVDQAAVDTSVKVETDRATAAEQTNAQGIASNKASIATETQRATTAEQANASNIVNETTRAKIAEKKNEDAVNVQKARVDANVTNIATNTTAISTETQRATTAEQTNATGIATNAQGIATNKAGIAANSQHFVTLQSEVAQKVDTGTFQQRAADVDARIAERKAAQEKTDKVVAGHTAELADHEARISDLEARNQTNFGKLKNEVESNRKRASAGIAGVAAIATIPQVLESQTFNVGAGVGHTDGENALAVGFSGRVSQSTVVKAAVSTDSQHNFVVGAGVAVGW